ncbi:MAG: ThiF family adenylyltransferase [Patescibacteria group bacterium]
MIEVFAYTGQADIWSLADDVFYLLGSNGLFCAKRNCFYSVLVPADPEKLHTSVLETVGHLMSEHEHQLEYVEIIGRIHLPGSGIPQEMLWQIVALFRQVWHEHQGEAEVQVFFDEQEQEFFFIVPDVYTVKGGYFCWARAVPTPPDCLRFGGVHSHADIPAWQSGTDLDDESDQDGLHMTIGMIDHLFPEIDCRVVVNGYNFRVNPHSVFQHAANDVEVPDVTIHLIDLTTQTSTADADMQEACRAYCAPLQAVSERIQTMPQTTYVVVGLGGVGTPLLQRLMMYLATSDPEAHVILADGKSYLKRKAVRQSFPHEGQKAKVQAKHFSALYPSMTIQPVPRFVTEDNVASIIPEGAVVFCLPDNNRARKVISDHCETLDRVTLINGGNSAVEEDEGVSGNVMVFCRRKGKNLQAPVTQYHPEIAEEDDAPQEEGCDNRESDVNQLANVNGMCAMWVMVAFEGVRTGTLTFDELFFTIGEEPSVVSHKRPPHFGK